MKLENIEQYTDKYFLRAKQILEQENINPIVRMQVFARTDADDLTGIDEAVDIIKNHANTENMKLYALPEHSEYKAKDAMIIIEAPIQDIIELETVYLGVISHGLTGEFDLEGNLKGHVNNAQMYFDNIFYKAQAIVQAAEDKPVIYFGARHYHWFSDQYMGIMCKAAGFDGASTDKGAEPWGQKGLGTIPHALILSYAASIEGNPTVNATLGFDKYMDKAIPRVALIDTYNKEIDDSIATAEALEGRLSGVRIDTCGSNVTQYSEKYIDEVCGLVPESEYRSGKGVTITSVWTLRTELDKAGYQDVSIFVSSGFNEHKTSAFVEADNIYQEKYGRPLFDAIGTGSIANPKMATADIVQYYDSENNVWVDNSKVGRGYKPNKNLRRVI